MSAPASEKWQRRLFVAKDGFLLYYAPSGAVDATSFDTKAKGAIPLGGCKVDLVERGPKAKYGIKITHPDFYAGAWLLARGAGARRGGGARSPRAPAHIFSHPHCCAPPRRAGKMLILSADSESDQKGWQETLLDCSRVTMENAKLGDALIEKMRASGPEAEKKAAEAMEKLQQQAMALKLEQEEMMKKHMDVETLKKMAHDAEVRAAPGVVFLLRASESASALTWRPLVRPPPAAATPLLRACRSARASRTRS